MSEQTAIAWCDSTFNPWIGCTKVSPGCDNCYAERDFALRKKRVLWGSGQERSLTKTWDAPVKWNKRPFFACAECSTDCSWRGECDGESCPACGGHVVPARRRVFCASLADVFDNEVPDSWRMDLSSLIAQTRRQDWLLLTKRIGNVASYLQRDGMMFDLVAGGSVWLGATICNQTEADRDIPKLLAVPARVRFLSVEPMLGAIDLARWLDRCDHGSRPAPNGAGGVTCTECDGSGNGCPRLHWVIVGGESGPHARPMQPEWARSLRDQCAAAGVPFFFKQWGGLTPTAGGCMLDDVEYKAWPEAGV